MTAKSADAVCVGLLLSGGLDSAILLWHLLKSGRRVQPFYVRCGLIWEEAEQAAVGAILRAAASTALEPAVFFEMPLEDLYNNHWSTTGRDAPDADSADEAVYLPGRNTLLTLKPALWCAMHGIDELAAAVLSSNPFSDATEEFFRDFEAVIERAAGICVKLIRPFGQFDKKEVMQLGRETPLDLTFSCIATMNGLHCGRCNKCAERQRAFRSIGFHDPTQYAIKVDRGGRKL